MERRSNSAPVVKDKSAAPVQITAEQLLREAWEHKDVPSASATSALPKLIISDVDELSEYQREERKTYEMRIVRNRSHIGLWMRYARWEEEQRDFVRARSIWERAIDMDYRSPVLWINYAEFEMRHRFINHARNVFDRAVALLPRVDTLWLRYAHMEEMLQRYDLARNVFMRWLQWLPEQQAYFSLIRFELRRKGEKGNHEKVRHAYQLLTEAFPDVKSFSKWAKFEERTGNIALARKVFETAAERVKPEFLDAQFFIAFAKFELRLQQIERARAIYKFGLSHTAKYRQQKRKSEVLSANESDNANDVNGEKEKNSSNDLKMDDVNENIDDDDELDDVQILQDAYTALEKQHGDVAELDALVIGKRRAQLEEAVKKDKYDYDAWYDLIQLEERMFQQSSSSTSTKTNHSNGINSVIKVYERAIINVPQLDTKAAWSRYIYLWLHYAAWAELHINDPQSSSSSSSVIEIYQRCVALVPHQHRNFSFAKLWMQYAHAEVRRGDLARARTVFGTAIGVLPQKHQLYEAYVQLECNAGEFERARDVFRIWLTRHPSHVRAFSLLADLELQLGEHSRALGILELGVRAVISVASEDEDEDEDLIVMWEKLANTVAQVCTREEGMERFDRYVVDLLSMSTSTPLLNTEDVRGNVLYHAWNAYVLMMTSSTKQNSNNDDDDNVDTIDADNTDIQIRDVFNRAFTALSRKARLAHGTHVLRARQRVLEMGTMWLEWEQDEIKREAVRRRLPKLVRLDDGREELQLADETGDRGRAAGNRLLAAARKWKIATANT